MAETIAPILADKGGNIWWVGPDATVYDAIAMMMEKRAGALLVIVHGVLVGIISERNYARKVILQGKSSKDTPVQEIMTRSVITVSPEHSVDECMRIIISEQAHTIGQLHTCISSTYPS